MSRHVAVSGRVERTGWHRSLLGRHVRPLPQDAKVARHAIAAYGERAHGAGALPA